MIMAGKPGGKGGDDPITDEADSGTSNPTPETAATAAAAGDAPEVYPTDESLSGSGTEVHAPRERETILDEGVRADHSLLIIEDDAWDAKLLEALLQGATEAVLDIAHAGALAEGIDRLERGKVQLILSDLNLPDSNAIETLPRLREAAPDTPIIVLSATSDEAVRATAMEAGAIAFLVKGEVGNDAIIAEIIGELETLPELDTS